MVSELYAIVGEVLARAVCLVLGHRPDEHDHKWFDPSSDCCDRCGLSMPGQGERAGHAEQRRQFVETYGPPPSQVGEQG